jgi:hypothetical protein
MPNAVVQLQLQSQVAPQIAQTANAYKTLSAEEQKAERQATAYAASLQKVALADAKTATEEQRLAIQTANAAKAQTQAEAAALRLAQAQEKAASGNSFASETAQAFTSQISAMVSPVALATAGIGALVVTANSFKEALHVAGQLQEERTAFGGIIGDFSKGNTILDTAIANTRAYGFTTKETTDAFKQLAPIIRESTSTVNDQAGALERISVLRPDDPVNALSGAIEGIRKGRFQEIAGEMGLSKIEAKQLGDEVAHGKDAFIALNDALDRHGITLAVARDRMNGYAGEERRAQQAAEDLQKAQAQFAAGPGLTILQGQIAVTRDATKLLQGDLSQLNTILRDSGVATVSILKPLIDYNTFVLDAGKKGLVWAGVLSDSSDAGNAAALAQQRADERMQGVGASAAAAAPDVDKLTAAELRQANAGALADQRAGERQGGGASGTAEGQAATDANAQLIFQRLAQGEKDRLAQQAQRLQDARDAYALAHANTTAKKIAELRRQQAATDDPVKKLQLQTQIEQEIQSGARKHTGELGHQLSLHESIYDSLNKQRDAALDIEELTIRDRQQDRADAAKIKTAQRILASPNASADLKARAADALDLISVEDRKRAQAIAEKSATAGGAIVNGKLLQSVAGGGALPSATATTAAGGAPLPSAPGPAGGAAGAVTINLVVDGKTLATVSEPYIMDSLLKAVRATRASQGA